MAQFKDVIRAFAVLLGGALVACTTPPTAVPSASLTATAAVASPTNAPGRTTCAAPPQPTYFPWGSARSVERVTNELGVEYVRYAGPATTGSSSAYFAIARAPVDRLSPAPHPGVVAARNVSGHQVVIFRVGDPGVGEVAARWQEGVDGCAYDAHLLFPSAGAADMDEIAKVIASLYVR